MANPADSIKDLLVTAGVGTFAAQTGWGIFIGQEPDKNVADTVITIYGTGGDIPNPKWAVDFPSVQIRVRAAPNDYDAGRTKAQEIKDALLGLPSQDINLDRLVSVRMIGDINELGYDEQNRPGFTTNFSLIIEPAVTGNRLPL